MPGLPGVTTTSAVRASTWASACSRPPLPTTQTLTRWRRRRSARGPGPTPDEADGHADLLGQEGDVVAGGRRHVAGRGRRAEVGAPARQLLVDRHRLVEGRLVVGQVRVADAVGLVGDADLDRLEGVEDVELGQRHLGQELRRTAWRSMTASNQPQRRLRPVLVPNSWPRSTSSSPTSFSCSVGNGPAPTRVT